ncbi:MAG: zf-HC2 domain-containing protein [Acidimicrobiales bacterium]
MSRRLHRRLRRAVDAWVDAELDEAEAAAVAAHLRTCWRCSSAAETARLVKECLRRLRHAQPPPLASARLRRFARDLAGR